MPRHAFEDVGPQLRAISEEASPVAFLVYWDDLMHDIPVLKDSRLRRLSHREAGALLDPYQATMGVVS